MEHLIPPLSAAWQEHLDADVAAAVPRVAAVIGPNEWVREVTDLPGWADVQAWQPDQVRSAAMMLHARACELRLSSVAGRDLLLHLVEREAPWTVAHLTWCLRQLARATGPESDYLRLDLHLPAAVAARLPGSQLTGLVPALEMLRDAADGDVVVPEHRRRLLALLTTAIRRARDDALPAWLGQPGDVLGAAVRDRLADALRGHGVADVMYHCTTLDKLTPDARWRRQGRELLRGAPHGDTVVRGILGCFAEHTAHVFDETDRLLRALAWLLADDPGEEATRLLTRVAATAARPQRSGSGHPRAQLTAAATITMLGRRDGDQPMTALARLVPAVRNKALAKRIRAVLTVLGEARGLSAAEVMELLVDDHGLDGAGRHVERLAGYEAVVAFAGDRARLTFTRDGTALKSVPAAVTEQHGDDLKRLRDLVKEIGRTLAAERQRVEGLLSEDRDWAYADGAARYLDHPLTGAIGRALIWEAAADDGWQSGLPVRDEHGWALRRPDGTSVRGARLRLWHPARAAVDEIATWRDHLVRRQSRQPFKQAFREIYLLTPAEERTATYSNRFAAHILRYRQAGALMQARGWQGTFLGNWDGGQASDTVKEFGGGRWRATFSYQAVENTERHDWMARYCTTDQVRFARRDGRRWQETALAEVPPLVFSEAMRDVDLFVGVTSIATDPQWLDAGERRFDAYWHRTAFGSLTATAQMRHEALARLLPRTKLAGRVELSERFLRVQGNLRGYRIHLGSGNIQMEPDDAYLCIVADRPRATGLHLPYDEDAVLTAIVSKAFLLAVDDTITDPSILRQLDR